MKLSIIIPVYNEEKTVEKLLFKVKNVKLPKGIKKELIIIDDGSIDNSLVLIGKFKKKYRLKDFKIIIHKVNLGKGAAVRIGIKKSSGDMILIQDADLEYDPNDYKKLLAPIIGKKAKVVYGTRLKNYPLILFGKNKTPLPFHLIANKTLTFITNSIYKSSITDMETCYKVFDSKTLKDLKLASNGFDIEPEITAKILKKGISISEVSIKVKPRNYSEGKKISSKDGLKAVWTLLKYRFID